MDKKLKSFLTTPPGQSSKLSSIDENKKLPKKMRSRISANELVVGKIYAACEALCAYASLEELMRVKECMEKHWAMVYMLPQILLSEQEAFLVLRKIMNVGSMKNSSNFNEETITDADKTKKIKHLEETVIIQLLCAFENVQQIGYAEIDAEAKIFFEAFILEKNEG